jgi:hypothetical protein
MLKKKIATLLIMFMVGSWCLYAQVNNGDGKDDDGEIVVAVILGLLAVGALIGTIAAVTEAPKDDTQPVLASSGNPIITYTSSELSKVDTKTVRTTFGNPILDHIDVGVSDSDAYVGIRFGF